MPSLDDYIMIGFSHTYWSLEQDVVFDAIYDKFLEVHDTYGALNWQDISDAERDFHQSVCPMSSIFLPLPSDFPVPRIAFPEEGYSPDFLKIGSLWLASQRLRDSLAQPATVIEFRKVEMVTNAAAVHQQNYRWMRVLAHQPAIDVERSDCDVDDTTNPKTGRMFRSLRFINRIALMENLRPQSEIFRADESPTNVFCTDALAQRVLAAGCTGMEFSDPANLRLAKHIHRYRTATGIAERRVGFLD